VRHCLSRMADDVCVRKYALGLWLILSEIVFLIRRKNGQRVKKPRRKEKTVDHTITPIPFTRVDYPGTLLHCCCVHRHSASVPYIQYSTVLS
jgi:hypothetical protein